MKRYDYFFQSNVHPKKVQRFNDWVTKEIASNYTSASRRNGRHYRRKIKTGWDVLVRRINNKAPF